MDLCAYTISKSNVVNPDAVIAVSVSLVKLCLKDAAGRDRGASTASRYLMVQP